MNLPQLDHPVHPSSGDEIRWWKW